MTSTSTMINSERSQGYSTNPILNAVSNETNPKNRENDVKTSDLYEYITKHYKINQDKALDIISKNARRQNLEREKITCTKTISAMEHIMKLS